MIINFSVDGVLRDTIQKLIYHYDDYFLNSETEDEEDFEYGISDGIVNDNLSKYFKFQSTEEMSNFLYEEFPIEIYGHAGLSYSNVFTELHKIIFAHKEHTFNGVALDNLGKARPATLFFLSKNGFLGDNVKFIKTGEIKKEWKNCDVWITDSKAVIDACPKGKTVIKFNTNYNLHFTNKLEINKLGEIEDLWKQFSEKNIISTLTRLVKGVNIFNRQNVK